VISYDDQDFLKVDLSFLYWK